MKAQTVQPELVRPAPAPDADTQFYWDGLRQHRLLIQECSTCRRRRFPPMPTCPYCGGVGAEVREHSGRGTLYSWVVVHRAFQPAFAAEVPYTLAAVDLEGGGRMVARLEPADAVEAGAELVAYYVDHDGWTEVRFRRA